MLPHGTHHEGKPVVVVALLLGFVFGLIFSLPRSRYTEEPDLAMIAKPGARFMKPMTDKPADLLFSGLRYKTLSEHVRPSPNVLTYRPGVAVTPSHIHGIYHSQRLAVRADAGGLSLPSVPSPDVLLFGVGDGIQTVRELARQAYNDKGFTGKVLVLTMQDAMDPELKQMKVQSGGTVNYDAYITKTPDILIGSLQALKVYSNPILRRLKEGGHVYLCGPFKVIIDEAVEALTKKHPEFRDALAAAKAEGRYHEDLTD